MMIVGAGKAAARAVLALRELGWNGAIILIGEEPEPPYDRPPLSKAALTAEAAPEPVFILDESMLASLGVTFLAGVAAVGISPAEKLLSLADGRHLPYHRLLLATGARARKLPRAEHSRTLRDLGDSRTLHRELAPGRKVVVIGGGFIGLEVAASASKRGCSVTVLESQPRILMRGVCASIATAVSDRHAAAGVSIVTGACIASVAADAVVLQDGQNFAADIIVAGIGAVPETALAEAAGLAIDNGIACDAGLRTSAPDIFAAGDCCSFPHSLYEDRRIRLEAWRAAADQAAVAAENMLGGNRRFEAVPWFWSDQYELSLQIAGIPGESAATSTRQLKDGAFIEFQFDGEHRLVCASGIGRGNIIARDIRLAEMLIAKRARPSPAALADAATGLKSLLAA
ncbi:MAG: FAD-dependent oxidoreductase [Pseudomonadota bacterium]|nr:FAD-dependent oxidoreductase [Pseudomonadota bacterium]